MKSSWIALSAVAVQAACPFKHTAGGNAPVPTPPPGHPGSFFSAGVHSDKGCDEDPAACEAGDDRDHSTDPVWPTQFTGHFTVHTVGDGWATYQPPYTSPPDVPVEFYTSYGQVWFDESVHGGTMMEFFRGRCIPIYEHASEVLTSCAYISMGNWTLQMHGPMSAPTVNDLDRCCLFSPDHKAPPRNFVAHLPRVEEESDRLLHVDTPLDAFSTKPGGVWFGYAFHRNETVEDDDGAEYRLPHSFYFSGVSLPDHDVYADMISQNFYDWSPRAPADEVWEAVFDLCGATQDEWAKLEWCAPPAGEE